MQAGRRSLTLETERALAELAGATPSIEVLVLFGSAAGAGLHAESDVDLYVRLSSHLAACFDRAAFATAASTLCRREVDVVTEGPATSVILRRQVAGRGRSLFERTPGAHRTLVEDAIRAYVDLEPQLRKIGAAIRARAATEGAEAEARIAARGTSRGG